MQQEGQFEISLKFEPSLNQKRGVRLYKIKCEAFEGLSCLCRPTPLTSSVKNTMMDLVNTVKQICIIASATCRWSGDWTMLFAVGDLRTNVRSCPVKIKTKYGNIKHFSIRRNFIEFSSFREWNIARFMFKSAQLHIYNANVVFRMIYRFSRIIPARDRQ